MKSFILLPLIFWPASTFSFNVDSAAHFGASFMISSTCHILLRKFSDWNEISRQFACLTATGTIGVGKEVYDRSNGKKFSERDILYDSLGAATSASLFYMDDIIQKPKPVVIEKLSKPNSPNEQPANQKRNNKPPPEHDPSIHKVR